MIVTVKGRGLAMAIWESNYYLLPFNRKVINVAPEIEFICSFSEVLSLLMINEKIPICRDIAGQGSSHNMVVKSVSILVYDLSE